MSSRSIGDNGEDIALQWYLNNSYKLIARNFEYRKSNSRGRLGELDIILSKENKLFFVEVKTRKSTFFGTPSQQITKKKMVHIYKSIQFFLSQKEYKIYSSYFLQFDLAEVVAGKLNIISNACNFDGF